MNKAILQHCTNCAEFHLGVAKLENAQAAATDGETAAYHTTMSDLHANQAQHFVEMAKCLKADGTEDDTDDSEKTRKAAFGMAAARDFDVSQLEPTAVHKVIPAERPELRAVPRFGGLPMPGASVPAEFADIIGEIE